MINFYFEIYDKSTDIREFHIGNSDFSGWETILKGENLYFKIFIKSFNKEGILVE